MQWNKIAARPVTYTFLLILFFNAIALGQFEVLPCDDPDNNGVGCYCETAGILCTPDLLNGFEFAMSDTENFGDLGDGPPYNSNDDLCPGTPLDGIEQGGVANNVNFFAFIVWCETLTFDVLVTNCTDNPDNNIISYGIQMALFANCPAANGGDWDPVSCITSGNISCFDSEAEVPTMQTFSASGLEIGATYYFMVDGCALSTCKVTINVQGECGNGEITPWDNGIFGAQSVCVGDTETYVAEDIAVGLDGAEEYYYYLNGVLIEEGEEIGKIGGYGGNYTEIRREVTKKHRELVKRLERLERVLPSVAEELKRLKRLERLVGTGEITPRYAEKSRRSTKIV